MENKEINCVEFFKALFSKCSPAYINLRFTDSKQNFFLPTQDIESIPAITAELENENCYFGVATREDNDGSKIGIKEIPALWADIDFKKITEEEARELVRSFQIQPTFVINSGGGVHVYWLLKQPVGPDSIPKVEDLLKRLGQELKGDLKVKDASHILRIPDTFNCKPEYNPKRRVQILSHRIENQYSLEDFEFLPEVILTSNINDRFEGNTNGWQEDILEGVNDGERNASLTQLAGRYVAKGLSRKECLIQLLAINSTYNPPKTHGEVETILNSVIKTHKTNHPDWNFPNDSPGKEFKEIPEWGEGKSLIEILDAPIIEPDYLINPILSAGDKGFLVAQYKKGKTLLMMDCALSLSIGRNWLGFKVPKPRKVLYIRFELKDVRFNQRLRLMIDGMGGRDEIQSMPIFEYPRGFEITNQAHFDWLKKMIDTHEPEALFLDPFYKLTSVLDIKDPKNAMPLLRKFEELRSLYKDLLIWLSHHDKKLNGQESGWDSAYGPMIYYADMDFEIKLTKQGEKFSLDFLSNDVPVDPIIIERNPRTLVHKFVGSEDELIWDRIMLIMRDRGEMQVESKNEETVTIKMLMDEEKGSLVSASRIREVVNERATRGDVHRNKRGRVHGVSCNVNLYSLK